ncbi:MAG TPA: gluconokinase [Anaerolineales bacterium]|nr:gluconokinase [Anaerolineales bacterium]HRQ91553.1 gluconokinase [Anaerolineales bacterium]
MTESIVVMGVSGSGKTRVGKALARAFELPFLEGDDFHPPANIAKMQAGQPLTDADRSPWLAALNQALQEQQARGQAVVLACSALKETYRQQLQQDGVKLRFVYLHSSLDKLRQRVENRRTHFMPASLLQSQFDALEEPEHAIRVDALLPVGVIVREVRNELGY